MQGVPCRYIRSATRWGSGEARENRDNARPESVSSATLNRVIKKELNRAWPV